MRWQSLSKDPNAAEVLAARRDALSRARAPNVADRVAYLCDLARGKRVLDIGVVEHFASTSASAQWLHGRLCEVAKSCIGVDILEEEIVALRTRGYDVRAVDLTRQAMDEKFELIVMGEIIEHIDAPGALLRNVAAMLEDGGMLVLTTPNPWYANVIVKNLSGAVSFTDSADHVGWYDAGTLYELGQRCGLELSRYAGVRTGSARTVLGKIFFGLASVLVALGMNPLLFAKTIVYEFKPSKF